MSRGAVSADRMRELEEATRDLAPPYAVVDLDAFAWNAADLLRRASGKPIRVASKSLRCRALLHLVELADPETDPVAALAVVEGELAAFDPDLVRRPRLVCGSKLDAAVPGQRERLATAAAERGLPFHAISSATGAGIAELRHLLQGLLRGEVAPAAG